MTLRTFLADSRAAPLAVLAASIAILGGALAFQYVGGLAPCVLCLYQRWPYRIAIVLSAAALAFAWPYGSRPAEGRRVALARGLVGLCGVLFLIGAGIAVFHVGVEQHWWPGTAECGGEASGAASVEQLEAMIKAAPVVRCDVVAWSLFGVSMAGYNVLLSLALAAFAFYSALRPAR
jgi:disulfide bond formation protein DsbB